jgi:hypothetical protein
MSLRSDEIDRIQYDLSQAKTVKEEFKNDPNFWLDVLSYRYPLLKHIPENIQRNKVFFNEIKEYLLSQTNIWASEITDVFKDDKDIILHIIENNDLKNPVIGLQVASPRLKKDSEILLKIFELCFLKGSGNYTSYLVNELEKIDSPALKDPNFVLKALKVNPSFVFSFATGLNPKYLDDKKFMSSAIEINPVAFDSIGESLKNDREFVISEIKKHPELKFNFYVRKDFKSDPEVKNYGTNLITVKVPYLPMYIIFESSITKKEIDKFKEGIKEVAKIAKASKLPNFKKVLNGDLYIAPKMFFRKNLGYNMPENAAASYNPFKDVMYCYTDTLGGVFVSDTLHELGHKYHNSIVKKGFYNENIIQFYLQTISTCELPKIGDPLSDLREDWWNVKMSSENDYYLTKIERDTYIYMNDMGNTKTFPKSKILDLIGCPSEYGKTTVLEWFAELCNLINLNKVKPSQKLIAEKFIQILEDETT